MWKAVIGYSHGHVLLLRKDGIVGLQIILLEQLFTVSDLHVEEGVTDAKELVRLRGHGGMRSTDDVNFEENKKPISNRRVMDDTNNFPCQRQLLHYHSTRFR